MAFISYRGVSWALSRFCDEGLRENEREIIFFLRLISDSLVIEIILPDAEVTVTPYEGLKMERE